MLRAEALSQKTDLEQMQLLLDEKSHGLGTQPE